MSPSMTRYSLNDALINIISTDDIFASLIRRLVQKNHMNEITSFCPLVNPRLISLFLASRYLYCSILVSIIVQSIFIFAVIVVLFDVCITDEGCYFLMSSND